MRPITVLPSVLAGCLLAGQVVADSVEARCDVYPAGEDSGESMPCTFSQRQGFITIRREDGVVHDLSPAGDQPGNFTDESGQAVYRQSGLGDQGQIFRMPEESVFVYWSTEGLTIASDDNPTAPFTTDQYDATTLLRCRASGVDSFGTCPAGILRMEDGQASIVVVSPAGETFTFNFMTDYVNAANREVDAVLNADTWTVTVDEGDVYEIPLAAIEGG